MFDLQAQLSNIKEGVETLGGILLPPTCHTLIIDIEMKIKNNFRIISSLVMSSFIGFGFLNSPKSASPITASETLPSKILNLSNWKITIPFDANGKDGENSEVAHDIKNPEFINYTLPNYYFVNTTNDGVVFRAHAGGTHTKGSGFPRCELREMIENGTKSAKWQSGIGTHTMEIEQAFTHLPTQKKHVVAGQIHSTGTFDDVITCRLENTKLFLAHNGAKGTVLNEKYTLGTRFKIKFVVQNDEIKTFFNDKLVETYPIQFPDAYFKAGCYTQSASWGKNNNHNAEPSEYGEVVIYKLMVEHH